MDKAQRPRISGTYDCRPTLCVFDPVSVCVRERQTDRSKERQREADRQIYRDSDRQLVCVCVGGGGGVGEEAFVHGSCVFKYYRSQVVLRFCSEEN